MYLKHVITAGILSAALAIGPGAAFAQSSGSTSGTSGTSSQGSSSQSSTSSPSSQGSQSGTTTPSTTSSAQHQSGSGGSGADQEAVRQHLTAAREALAELTKLPAASQLQGERRQQVAQLISDFNAFATATTDWRPKYQTRSTASSIRSSASMRRGRRPERRAAPLQRPARAARSASTSPTADASTAAPTASSGAVGTAGSAAGGALDPTIVAKLQEVRKHLDGFEEASGDPTFVVEKIEKILEQAAGAGSASGAVGTSGSTGSASAGGSVTLTAAQVQEVRRQLESIKAAAKR